LQIWHAAAVPFVLSPSPALLARKGGGQGGRAAPRGDWTRSSGGREPAWLHGIPVAKAGNAPTVSAAHSYSASVTTPAAHALRWVGRARGPWARRVGVRSPTGLPPAAPGTGVVLDGTKMVWRLFHSTLLHISF